MTVIRSVLSQFAPKPLEPPQFAKHERISNFLTVPFQLEKFLFIGVLICFDSLLYNLTILPLRIIFGLLIIIFKRDKSYFNDILMGLLIACSCIAANSFDTSNLYHTIRSQSTLKLYVIFNVLEVLDKLFSSFGLDVLDAFFSQAPPNRTGLISSAYQFILSAFYIILHCLILLYQVITLNVAVNSYSNSVLSLLVSNQFMELKSSVFKKFERENLFQLSCSDSIERFQLFLFIFVIAARNLSQIGIDSGIKVWNRVAYPLILIYCAEIGIDGLKHAFITKFNHIPPNVYRYFQESISNDFSTAATTDQSSFISRKIGFSSLPHTCFVLVICYKLLKGRDLNLALFSASFITLLLLKVFLGYFLMIFTRNIHKNAKEFKAKVEIESKTD